MSDFTFMRTNLYRRALRLRDGVVDFDDLCECWLDLGRERHNLPLQSVLEIQSS